LSVRAETNPSTVGSVAFEMSGDDSINRTENYAPYALLGDSSGNYSAWEPGSGNYTLTVTPYSESGQGGTAGAPYTVNFTVIDSAPTPTPAPVLQTIAFDGFENVWNGGSGDWSGGWSKSGDVSTSTSGEHSGSYHAYLNGKSDITLSRTVNMSGVTNATLEFWWKANSIEGNDDIKIQVDDGSGWQTVLEITKNNDDNSYHKQTVSLSENSTVKFRVLADLSHHSDDVYIDDITITGYK